jgi:hypothetical protein
MELEAVETIMCGVMLHKTDLGVNVRILNTF